MIKFTDGPFNKPLDSIALAYQKIIGEAKKTEPSKVVSEEPVVKESFADKFKAKRKAENQKVELSSKGKQKEADKKDPKHQEKVKTAKKRWLEHITSASKKKITEEPVTPTLATKLKGARTGALKPQSEVGKTKKPDVAGGSSILNKG